MMGGFFAPELKYAGYDKVILRGKSPDLVYLWINNDRVEIRDAAHLKGKGAIETAQIIRQELKEPKVQVAAIGLAGENRVFYASIEQGRSSASRGGIGAVMGDKGGQGDRCAWNQGCPCCPSGRIHGPLQRSDGILYNFAMIIPFPGSCRY